MIERIREEFKQNFGYELMHKFNIKSGSLCEEITYFAFTNLLSIKGIYTEKDIKEAEKAGIQKVVDWIQREESNCMDCSTPYKFTLWDWQAFLKEVEK